MRTIFGCISGSGYKTEALNQTKVRAGITRPSSRKEDSTKAESRDIQSAIAMAVPNYLNLEPSLAMDWLEISWDELRIKERVGAGMVSFLVYLTVFRLSVNEIFYFAICLLLSRV